MLDEQIWSLAQENAEESKRNNEGREGDNGDEATRRWPMKSRTVSSVYALAILSILFLVVPARAELSLPSTPLSLLAGGTLNLQSLKGSVAVIRFLASW